MYAGYEDQIYEEQPKVLYVFANDNKHVAIITGRNEPYCDATFAERYGTDDFWASYDPYFGDRPNPGELALVFNPAAEKLDADLGRPDEDEDEDEGDEPDRDFG